MADNTKQARYVQEKLIKTEIPVILSQLVLEGKKNEALELLIAWGTRQKDNESVWEEARLLANSTEK